MQHCYIIAAMTTTRFTELKEDKIQLSITYTVLHLSVLKYNEKQ